MNCTSLPGRALGPRTGALASLALQWPSVQKVVVLEAVHGLWCFRLDIENVVKTL